MASASCARISRTRKETRTLMRSKFPHWFTMCAVLALIFAPLPSSSVELETIARAAADYQNANPRLQAMYRAALLNTSRQATIAPDGTSYVKTGDIPAEWLRDASAQVRPYLFFAKDDPRIAGLLRGIVA